MAILVYCEEKRQDEVRRVIEKNHSGSWFMGKTFPSRIMDKKFEGKEIIILSFLGQETEVHITAKKLNVEHIRYI